MIPKIFDTKINGEPVDSDFNAVKIVLDGSLKSDLKWEAEKAVAKKYIDQGLKIFWEIDLGLFANLPCPLQDDTQSKTLRLSLEIFCQEIWESFKEQSLGLCLYRGSCDFTHSFPWTAVEKEHFQEWLEGKESSPQLVNLFCSEVYVDYLNFITENLPDNLPLFLMLDASGVKDAGYLAELLSRERFERFTCIIHGGDLPLHGLAWDDDRAAVGYIARRPIRLKSADLSNVALCLPPISKHLFGTDLSLAIDQLNQLDLNYRIIPEPFLTMEWDQLDYLLYLPSGLSSLGERMVQGFCAAGGTPVTLGEKLSFPGELTLEEWTEKLLEIL